MLQDHYGNQALLTTTRVKAQALGNGNNYFIEGEGRAHNTVSQENNACVFTLAYVIETFARPGDTVTLALEKPATIEDGWLVYEHMWHLHRAGFRSITGVKQ